MAVPKIRLRKAESLKPSPTNSRTHSVDQLGQIEASLLKFGFVTPLVIDDAGIIAGHGRNEAAKNLYARGEQLHFPGGDPIPAGMVPTIDATGWSDEQRRAYMIADNQIALNAGWDEDLLKAELAALNDMEFNLAAIGFDSGALDELLGQIEADRVRQQGSADTTFQHHDQFGVIVMCANEAEQQKIFERLRDEGLSVKVVVV